MGLFDNLPGRSKKWFYEQAKRFFDNGLIYEIYSSDRLCICNIANQCYAVFDFQRSKIGPTGMYISPKSAYEIAKDNSYARRMADADWDTCLHLAVILDDKRYELFQRFKQKNDLIGPSSDIDPELESKIRELSKY